MRHRAARRAPAFGSIEETLKEVRYPDCPSRLEALQAFADPMPHASGKTRRQYSWVLAACHAAQVVRELAVHCGSDPGKHQVGTFHVFPLSEEEDFRLAAQAFAVKELADRRSDENPGCVHAQHLDPSDRDGSLGHDLLMPKKHLPVLGPATPSQATPSQARPIGGDSGFSGNAKGRCLSCSQKKGANLAMGKKRCFAGAKNGEQAHCQTEDSPRNAVRQVGGPAPQLKRVAKPEPRVKPWAEATARGDRKPIASARRTSSCWGGTQWT